MKLEVGRNFNSNFFNKIGVFYKISSVTSFSVIDANKIGNSVMITLYKVKNIESIIIYTVNKFKNA